MYLLEISFHMLIL